MRAPSKTFASGFLVILLLLYVDLGWNARERILQGNSDFIIYYTAIQMVKDGKGSEIYDLSTAHRWQQRILDEVQAPLNLQNPFRAGLLYFVNPPMALAWFLPLRSFSYLQALLVWDLISVAFFIIGILVLVRKRVFKTLGFTTIAAFAFPPVFITLLQGQVSALLFLATALVYWSLRQKREITAGLWLSLLLTKFQLLPPFLILFLWKRCWKVLGGFLLGSLGGLILSLQWVGVAGIRKYFGLIVEMGRWVNQMGMTPRSMHCLRGQFNAWWYESHPWLALILTAVCGIGLLVLLIREWGHRAKDDLELCYSLLVIVSVLTSPHLYIHDLSLLLVPGLILFQKAEYLASQRKKMGEGPVVGKNESSLNMIGDLVGRHLNLVLFSVGYPLLWMSVIISGLIPIQLSVWMLVFLFLALTRMPCCRSELPHSPQET